MKVDESHAVLPGAVSSTCLFLLGSTCLAPTNNEERIHGASGVVACGSGADTEGLRELA